MTFNAETTGKIVDILHKVLANQHLLYQNLRTFHWNVTGPHFAPLHELFEKFYDSFSEDIDEIAERIRSFSQLANGSFSEYLKLSEIEEAKNDLSAEDMIKKLIQDYEALIKYMYFATEEFDDLDDTGSEDIMIGMTTKYEKQLWMLKSSL